MLVHRLWPNLEKKNMVTLGLRQFCPFNFSSIIARKIESGSIFLDKKKPVSSITGTQFRRLQETSFVSFVSFRFTEYRKPGLAYNAGARIIVGDH